MKTMSQMWERVRSVPGMTSNVATTIATVLIGLVCTVFLLMHYDIGWPWQHEYTFNAAFEKTVGMRVQSKHKVEIAGVPVGTVRGLEPQRDNTALVTMAIDPGFPVYKNAHLELRTLSPVNDIVVALEPGTPDSGPLPEGGTIPASQTSTLVPASDVLDKLDDRSQAAISSLITQADIALRDAPRTLPAGLNATDQTLSSLRPVVAELDQRRSTLQKLITNLSNISTAAGARDQRLASLITSLQTTLGTLSSRDDQLNSTLSQLPGLRGDLDHSMTSVSNLTTQLNPTIDALHSASGALPSTLKKLEDVADQAGPVIDKARPVVQQAGTVVNDLSPLVSDVHGTVDDLKPVTGLLPDATARLVPWLPNLQAFVYQTSSAFSLADANGGQGRMKLAIDPYDPTSSYGAAPETKQNRERSGQ